MEDKNKKIDYKTLNEILKNGNFLLKLILTISILAIGVLVIYLFDKTSFFLTIGHVLGILAPLFIGLFLAWLLEPAIHYFEKNKVGRKLATFVVYLILVFLVLLILALILPEFISQLNELIKKIPSFLEEINKFINNVFKNFSSSNFDSSSMKDNLLDSINSFVNNITTNDLEGIVSKLSSSFKTISDILLGVLIGFYLSLDFSKLNKYLALVIPKRFHKDLKTIRKSLNTMLRNYVNGTLLSCLFVLILCFIGFLISGVSSPLLFAIFCAIVNVIPYFGPYIGAIPVVIVGLTINPWVGVICLLTIVIVQFVDGNILHPLIVGKAVSLHPITIMLSLLIFQYFFGIIGMIVATPIVATLKILYLFFEDKYHFMNKISNE